MEPSPPASKPSAIIRTEDADIREFVLVRRGHTAMRGRTVRVGLRNDLERRQHLRSVIAAAVGEGAHAVGGPHEVAVETDRARLSPWSARHVVQHPADVVPADQCAGLYDDRSVRRPGRLLLEEEVADVNLPDLDGEEQRAAILAKCPPWRAPTGAPMPAILW